MLCGLPIFCNLSEIQQSFKKISNKKSHDRVGYGASSLLADESKQDQINQSVILLWSWSLNSQFLVCHLDIFFSGSLAALGTSLI